MSPGVPSAPLYDEINFSGSLSGESRQLSSPDHSGESTLPKGKVSKSPDRYGAVPTQLHKDCSVESCLKPAFLHSTLCSPSSPIQEEDEEKLSEMSDAQAHTLLSSSPAPTEVRFGVQSALFSLINSLTHSRFLTL